MTQPAPAKKTSAVEALERLTRILEEKKTPADDLTEEQVGVLQDMAKMLLAFKAMGTLGGIAYRTAMWILFFIGIWFAIKAGVVEWIQHVVASKK